MEQIDIIKQLIELSCSEEEKQTIDEYSKELEIADDEIEKGSFILHEDVVKLFTKLK